MEQYFHINGMIEKGNYNFKQLLIGFFIGSLISFSSIYLVDFIKDKSQDHNKENKIILVNKGLQTLTVYDALLGVIKTYKISTGQNPGNKIKNGDLKTPEGIFPVIGIEESSDWTYDFKDGKGPIKGSYGPKYIRLKVDSLNIFDNVISNFNFTSDNEFIGIGIHGTHIDSLIGSRASHGCIRLKNKDLLDLLKYIRPGTLIAITPGKLDLDKNRTIESTLIK